MKSQVLLYPNVGLSGYWGVMQRERGRDADTGALHHRNIAQLTNIDAHPGNSPSTLATYSFLTCLVLICVSISLALAGFLPNMSSPEVSLSSLNTMDITLFACANFATDNIRKCRYIVKDSARF